MIAITTSNSIRVKPRRESTFNGNSSLADESVWLAGSIRWGPKFFSRNQTQPMILSGHGVPSPNVAVHCSD
jgi:hypothetical protein